MTHKFIRHTIDPRMNTQKYTYRGVNVFRRRIGNWNGVMEYAFMTPDGLPHRVRTQKKAKAKIDSAIAMIERLKT